MRGRGWIHSSSWYFEGRRGDYRNKTKDPTPSVSELFSQVGAGCVILKKALVACRETRFVFFFLQKNYETIVFMRLFGDDMPFSLYSRRLVILTCITSPRQPQKILTEISSFIRMPAKTTINFSCCLSVNNQILNSTDIYLLTEIGLYKSVVITIYTKQNSVFWNLNPRHRDR